MVKVDLELEGLVICAGRFEGGAEGTADPVSEDEGGVAEHFELDWGVVGEMGGGSRDGDCAGAAHFEE